MKKSKDLLLILSLYSLGFISVFVVELLSLNTMSASGEAKLTFDISKFSAKLPSLLVTYFSLICYITSTLIYQIGKFKKENQEYSTMNQKVAEFCVSYKPVLLDEFCNMKNAKRKVEFYTFYLNRKWNKITKKLNDKDIVRWNMLKDKIDSFSKEELETWLKNDFVALEDKRIIKLIKLYMDMKPQKIKEALERSNFKYDRITAGLILGGTEPTGSDAMDKPNYISKHKALTVVEDRAPSVIATSGAIAFITSLAIEDFAFSFSFGEWLMFAVRIFVKIYSLINSIYSTTKYAEIYNYKITLKDLRFRVGLISEYNSWEVGFINGKINEHRKCSELAASN